VRRGSGPGAAGCRGQDHHVALLVVLREPGQPDGDGVTGPALGGLLDEFDLHPLGGALDEGLGHPLGAVPDDDDHAVHVELGEGVEHVEHHRAPAQVVEGFGRLERIRDPSPAARTTADSARVLMRPFFPLAALPVPSHLWPPSTTTNSAFSMRTPRSGGSPTPVLRWCAGWPFKWSPAAR